MISKKYELLEAHVNKEDFETVKNIIDNYIEKRLQED